MVKFPVVFTYREKVMILEENNTIWQSEEQLFLLVFRRGVMRYLPFQRK